jgi:para-nitrobenzyl esterase
MMNETVTTEHGPIMGTASENYRIFYDVPYAAGPSGRARFEAPRPPEPWLRVRDASAPGPTAPQPDLADAFAPLNMRPYFGPGWVRGEDYLTANIWAPVDGERRPVMVLIPGGGLAAGSAAAGIYRGDTFARDGVVLVTVNHRLGIPGFLDLPDAPRNRGLLDIIAALGWVQGNIKAFGGDPGNVTLIGESAGAILTAGIVADERAKGLLSRAILQSGSGTAAFAPEQAALVTAAAAQALGVAPTVEGFAGVSDDAFVAALAALSGPELRTESLLDPLVGLNPLSLVLDEQPAARMAAGVGTSIDLIVGTNAEEGRLYLAPSGAIATSTRDDLEALARQVHRDPARLLEAYDAAYPTASPGDLRALILGDALFTSGSRATARAHASHPNGRLWSYEFRWQSPALEGGLGAAHTVELPFVFDALHMSVLTGSAGLLGPEQVSQQLAEQMHRAWVGFATHGHPGWPPFDLENRRTQVFAEHSYVESDPRGSLLSVWE